MQTAAVRNVNRVEDPKCSNVGEENVDTSCTSSFGFQLQELVGHVELFLILVKLIPMYVVSCPLGLLRCSANVAILLLTISTVRPESATSSFAST